jgi:benzylsuccinate CoA-transferase BbsF subunit
MTVMNNALKNVNVVEFAAFAAGPMIGKYMANHGATVASIESRKRPDGFRLRYPPYWDDEKGLNRSGCFAIFNDGKYGITVNLKTEKGTKLAKELAAWADVVIENFSPGTIERLGLGYDVLSDINPELVMLSSSNQGQTGPHAQHPGFGSQLSSLAGFTHHTGYENGSPQIVYGPYIDLVAVGYGYIAVMAALARREKTGEGQYIDLSQYENGVQFLASALLHHDVNDEITSRGGNKTAGAAPHGAYPCRGDDEWCVVSVHDDTEWRAFCEATDNGSLISDPRFATYRSRKENEDALDELVAEWTQTYTAETVTHRLQNAGVHAMKVNTMADLYTDPQLDHRNTWWDINHSEVGKHEYESPPFRLSETPAEPGLPDPCLGEHNEEFFRSVFDMDESRYERLVDEEVIY